MKRYIVKFSPTKVELSDGTILTCDKSKGQSFDYDILKKIFETENDKKEIENER